MSATKRHDDSVCVTLAYDVAGDQRVGVIVGTGLVENSRQSARGALVGVSCPRRRARELVCPRAVLLLIFDSHGPVDHDVDHTMTSLIGQ